MTKRRAKTVALAALVLALVGLLLSWPGGDAPPSPAATDTPAPAAAPAAPATGTLATSPERAHDAATPREAIAPSPATGRGDLVVRLLYGDDRSPAAGVMVTAFRRNEIPRNSTAPSVDSKRRRTDAEGIARFPSMRAGRAGLVTDRGHWFEQAYVVAGKETEVEFVMPVGVTVRGVVVSALRVPVAGADVELESNVVATTDGHGRFTVRAAAPHYAIGARAPGHGASKAQQLMAHDGQAEVRLELGPAGGSVQGVALDPDGRPLADVRIDIGSYEGSRTFVGDAPPRPARARTDAEGRFQAIGIPLGQQPLKARASGFVPWSGTCQVTATTPAVVEIALRRGNTLRGRLRDADGRPCGDVLVGAEAGDLDWDEVVAPDGTFEFVGLPDGDIDLKVDAEAKGKVQMRVSMSPGGVVTTCELTLVCGFVARGTVRDEAGRGMPHVNIRWQQGRGYTFTDAEGAFAIANVPEGPMTIDVDGDAIDDARFADLDPRAGPLDLRVHRRAAKTVYIAGLVQDADGRPASARAWASGGGSRDIVEANTDATGFFEIGPVSPGEWHVRIESRAFPGVSFDRRKLEANARWDVGTVRLARGGDVRVEVVDGSADGASFSIVDANERWFGLRVQQGKGTSDLLPTGNYRLLVAGKTQAAQSIPFEIVADRTASIPLRLHAGVRQRFDIGVAPAIEARSGSLRILRGTERVANAWARREADKPCTAEACLAPGSYSVVATFGGGVGTATFVVGEREGEVVRIDVQPAK